MGVIDMKAVCANCARQLLHTPLNGWWHYPSGTRGCADPKRGLQLRDFPTTAVASDLTVLIYDGEPWSSVTKPDPANPHPLHRVRYQTRGPAYELLDGTISTPAYVMGADGTVTAL